MDDATKKLIALETERNFSKKLILVNSFIYTFIKLSLQWDWLDAVVVPVFVVVSFLSLKMGRQQERENRSKGVDPNRLFLSMMLGYFAVTLLGISLMVRYFNLVYTVEIIAVACGVASVILSVVRASIGLKAWKAIKDHVGVYEGSWGDLVDESGPFAIDSSEQSHEPSELEDAVMPDNDQRHRAIKSRKRRKLRR